MTAPAAFVGAQKFEFSLVSLVKGTLNSLTPVTVQILFGRNCHISMRISVFVIVTSDCRLPRIIDLMVSLKNPK